jgi:prophage DNA circulation protein
MTSPADAFPRAAFDAVEFPYSEVTVKGASRHAIHEYPHTAGGEPEKMGRRPYMISFRGVFHDVPGSDMWRDYPRLYPDRLRQLRDKFDKELTADLVVPTVGTIKAFATSWAQKFDVRVSSGETFDLEFLEDQQSATLVDFALEYASMTVIRETNDSLQIAAALADFNKVATVGLFQKINDAVTAVQAVSGQADAYARVVEGKIQAVVNLCAYADAALEEMQDPVNHLILNALKDLWLASKELAENIVDTRQDIREYRLPKVMSIGEVSNTLFGTTERGWDILQMNAIEDAFAIPAGTLLKFVA